METFERVLPGLGAAGGPGAAGHTSVPRGRRPAPLALTLRRRRAWRRCSARLPGGAPLRRVVPRTAHQDGRRRVRGPSAQGAVADIQEHHATHGDGAALHSDGCRVRRAGSVSRALIHAEAGALGADHCGGRLEPNARRLSRLAARPPARRSPVIIQRIGMRRQSSSRVPQIVFGVAAWGGRRLRGIPRRGQGLQPRLQLLNRLPICADQTHGQDRA